jgi:uncharacterized protein YbjT (DUF2867 family)
MAGQILVLGAGGNVGKPLVEALLAKGETVKAASRSGKAAGGATGVVFDVADPATFDRAFEGVDRAFVLLPTGTTAVRETLVPIIEAAAKRGVKVVLMTAFGVDADDSIPYRQAEIVLQKSGTPYVILRPTWFADNFHTFWKAGVDHGRIAVPAGDGRTGFIDARDIAASAAVALTTSAHDGKAFNLTGPEALGYADAAAILTEVLGKPVAYTPVDDDTFVGILTGAGVPQDYARFIASIFYPVRQGWTNVVTGDVQTLTGKPPRSLRDYARDNKARRSA